MYDHRAKAKQLLAERIKTLTSEELLKFMGVATDVNPQQISYHANKLTAALKDIGGRMFYDRNKKLFVIKDIVRTDQFKSLTVDIKELKEFNQMLRNHGYELDIRIKEIDT
jgi:hypothetical protein